MFVHLAPDCLISAALPIVAPMPATARGIAAAAILVASFYTYYFAVVLGAFLGLLQAEFLLSLGPRSYEDKAQWASPEQHGAALREYTLGDVQRVVLHSLQSVLYFIPAMTAT
eukprot:13950-Heterococcus_DN1.PRE.11